MAVVVKRVVKPVIPDLFRSVYVDFSLRSMSCVIMNQLDLFDDDLNRRRSTRFNHLTQLYYETKIEKSK